MQVGTAEKFASEVSQGAQIRAPCASGCGALEADGGVDHAVAGCLERFRERYPEGRTVTSLIDRPDGWVVFRAMLFRRGADTQPAATGWAARCRSSQISRPVEEAESAALARALAHLGFDRPRPVGLSAPAASLPQPGPETLPLPAPMDPHLADLHDLLVTALAMGGGSARIARVKRAISERRLDVDRTARLTRHFQRWLIRRSVLALL